jgi:hypothetical protein
LTNVLSALADENSCSANTSGDMLRPLKDPYTAVWMSAARSVPS